MELPFGTNLDFLFGDRSDVDGKVDGELRSLERQARRAPSGLEAPFYNRAGDRCVSAARGDEALDYYGRAIDAYLEVGRFDAAGAVCRKLLRVFPDAVRARCTLAWLAIGKRLSGDARAAVESYVEVARRAGREAWAVRHLRFMAGVTTDRGLLRTIAGQLRDLGENDEADRVVATAAGDESSPPADEERWEAVLRAALMGPDELSEMGAHSDT